MALLRPPKMTVLFGRMLLYLITTCVCVCVLICCAHACYLYAETLTKADFSVLFRHSEPYMTMRHGDHPESANLK